MEKSFFCGPIEIKLVAQDPQIAYDVAESFSRYDVLWDRPHLAVNVCVLAVEEPACMINGNYLNCARMNVDKIPSGLRATSKTGSSCTYSAANDEWKISVPPFEGDRERLSSDIDDLVTLILTSSWRRAGWVPLHAGAVSNGKLCALVCAPSGVGKTTLVTAMIHRNWVTLGDDKLLLRFGLDGLPEVAALVHSFNLDPNAKKWFPEAHAIERLPRYSAYTEKRRVHVEHLWPMKTSRTGKPTHLIQIARSEAILDHVQVSMIPNKDVLSILLSQTVIPKDRLAGTFILSTITSTAEHLTGYRATIGANTYDNADALGPLEAALL